MLCKKLKKAGAWLLTFALVLGTLSFSGVKAEETGTDDLNLALNATPTASNSESGNGIERINDGNEDTRWAHNQASSAWVQYTWDQAQTMKSFYILWERRTAQALSLEISDDGENWTPVYSREEIPKSLKDEIVLEEPVTAKYLKLNVTSINDTDPETSTTWRAVSIWEFEVYEGERPDNRTEVEKVADSIAAPGEIAAGAEKIPMPENLSDGMTAFFYADYKEVVDEDGAIHTPLEDKAVKGFYEITAADGSTARTSEFIITIPGQYTSDENANAKPAVIPELQEWHGGTGNFIAKDDSKIVIGNDALKDVADAFAEDYKDITGMEISVVSGNWSDARMGDFYLGLTSDQNGLGKEGYTISVNHSVIAEAEESVGAYWATRTILQILKQTNGSIPKGLVRDYPKYEVRGFSLDVGRKPISLDALYQFAKNMSWYKMNSFQVHLSDNLIFQEDYATLQQAIEEAYAGFRLESDVLNDEGNSATSTDLFYTKDEFREFIQQSRVIGVDIVPELDMPAHALPFTRAFPQFMTAKTGGSHSYLIEELDLTKMNEVIPWAQSIWNDYFEGPNPVFDEEMTVHIGTDEYHGVDGQEGKELFREFSDKMIKFVQGTGRNVRMWGSLSNKTGTTPVTVDDVQLNIWNTSYSVPKDMHELGYDMINTLDGSLYMVPNGNKNRGGYGDYLNTSYLYNNWQANTFSSYTMPAGDDQMLGACFAVWHDNIDTRANGISQYDSFDRFFDALPMFSAKTWGDAKDRNYTDFTSLITETGTAPNTNMYAEVDFATNTVADWTFDDTITADASVNKNDLTEVKNAEQVDAENGKAISLKGGESYAETPLDQVGSDSVITMKVKMDADADTTESEQILCESKESFGNIGTYALKASVKQTGKVGFSREGYTYSFDYTLPKGKWVELAFHSGQDTVALYVDGQLEDDNPGIYYDNHPDEERSSIIASRGTTKISTMMVPIGRIGSKTESFEGQIDFVTIGGSKEITGSTVVSQTLQAEVAKYPDSAAASYTDMSWNALVKARDKASEVLSHAGSTDEDYTYAYEELQNAAANLKQKPEGYDQEAEDSDQFSDDLQQTLDTINKYLENTDSYTEETAAKLQSVLSSVKNQILQNPNATQEDLSAALADAVKNAGIIVQMDEKSRELQNEVTAAESKLQNTAGFTKESVAALQSAVDAAKKVLAKEDATLDEITKALTDLQGKTLVKDASKSDPVIKDNDPFEVDGIKYQVVSASALTAKLIKGKDIAKVTVDTVPYGGKTYKIVEIGDAAFSGCKKKLKKVTIGANVAVIGKNAFKGCKKLASVTVKKNSKLTKVGGGAFKKTSSKIKISLPKNLKKNKKLKKQLKKAGIKKGL